MQAIDLVLISKFVDVPFKFSSLKFSSSGLGSL
jgi:hypothetical protein